MEPIYKKRTTARQTINTIPLPFIPNNAQQAIIAFSNPKHMFACFNQGRINFSLVFQGVVTGNQVTQILPSLACVSVYTLNMTNVDTVNEEKKASEITLKVSSNSGRGDLGFVLALADRCSQQSVMEGYLENTTSKTFPPGTTNTQLVIPMGYLIDEFGLRRFLDVSYVRLELTLKPLQNVFFCPNSPNFSVTCPAVYVDYPAYEIVKIHKSLASPDKRLWQLFDVNLPVGTQKFSYNLSIAGKPIRLLHWSFIQTSSTLTNPGVNSFVPNQFSVVTYQQFQVGGGMVFPPHYQYNALYDTSGNEQNTDQLYNEFLGCINKRTINANNSLDYQNWRDNYRIYGFMIDDDNVRGGNYPFNIEFSAPTVNACIHRVAIQYYC